MAKRFSVLYAYTDSLREKDGQIKVGSAYRMADSAQEAAERRIKEQATAASPEKKNILHVEDVTDIASSMSELRTLEKHIHKKWKLEGRWAVQKQNSEWFWVSLEEVLTAFNGLRGVFRPHKYKMRKEQSAGVNKAVKYFNDGGDRFLLNAKMRYGKTFSAYHVAKKLEAKNVLIVSYKTQVDAGWQEDLENHVDFDGWSFVHKNDFSKTDPIKLPKGISVLWSSYQDINDMSKTKWKNIRKQHFDLIIVDEYHFGAGTQRALKTIEGISHDKVLCMSGTPIKALLSGEFDMDAIYTWSYLDEQKMKVAGSKAHQNLPTMKLHTIEVSEEAKELMTHYEENEGFTLAKLFSSDDGKRPNDLHAVNAFLDQIAGRGYHKNMSPYNFKGAKVNMDHTVWFVYPRRKTINALVNTLRNHPAFKDYDIFAATGDSDDVQDKVLNDVKRMIFETKRTKRKSITVAGSMLNTGVTVKDWNAVFMLNDTEAPETYFQSIFRCQSPAKNKDECYVFDFNPQRAMVMAHAHAEIMAPTNTSTEDYLEEWLDFAPIIDHAGNKLQEVNVGQILDAVMNSGDFITQFSAERMFNKTNIDANVIEILSTVDAFSGITPSTGVNDNGVNKGKNKVGKKKKKGQQDLDKKVMTDLLMRAKSITIGIPQFLYVNGNDCYSCKSIISLAKRNKDVAADFSDFMSVSHEDFRTLLELDFINQGKLDRAIISYTKITS